METPTISSWESTSLGTGSAERGTSALSSDDFFKLLIAQLTNQDPLEPTGNQELLNQISSIREIELSSTLVDSLKSLSQQQRFASASSLIGQFVTGGADATGMPISGVVKAVRFDATGSATLELADGRSLPLKDVKSVMGDERAAESMTGRYLLGWDRSTPDNPQLIEGLVTGVSRDDDGQIMLELDTGQAVALPDVIEWRNADDFEDTGGSAG